MRKKIVAGNWKMNKTFEQGLNLVDEIINSLAINQTPDVLKIIIPPFIHINALYEKTKHINDIEIGAQNCNANEQGAFTGEISASMISSCGAKYVIIGHSERRQYFNETANILSQKVSMALANHLTPIFCVGENLQERNNNTHLETVKQQLKETVFNLSAADFSKLIIAYEPVWAIGTGMTATSHQAQGMHNFIRSEINKKYGKDISENISILYGGSCNAENAKELFACIDVDGGLIGGASLKATDFVAIANSF
jgi:triosephosphate isomerase